MGSLVGFREVLVFVVCMCASFWSFADGVIKYTYTSTGKILTVDGPRLDLSDILTYKYDQDDNLVGVNNALGQSVKFSDFDSQGRAQEITDSNGVATSFKFTVKGLLESVVVDGGETLFAYNSVGDVTRITDPNGGFLQYTYDESRRVIGVSNAMGESQTYVLDAMGNRILVQVKDSNGTILRQQQRTYDELGRILTLVGAAGQITRFSYDLNGQQNQKINALNNSSSSAFDALGRIYRITDANGGVTELKYDAGDNVSKVIDARGVTTQYSYDEQDRVLQIKSPDAGTSNFSYDEAGNLKQKVDALGQITNYKYDALNRLASISYPEAPMLDVVYGYDQTSNSNKGVGRLTSIKDASGVVSYAYDEKGQRITQDWTANLAGLNVGSSLHYTYDKAGRVIKQVYPDNISVAYQRNKLGRTTDVTLSVNGQGFSIAKNISYMPLGPLKELTWGNGLSLNRSYDRDYKIISQTVGGWQNQYEYDLVGNLSNHRSNLWGAVQYQYDALGRLTQEQNLVEKKDYVLDAAGNRAERRTTELSSGTVSEAQISNIAKDSNRVVALEGVNLPYDAAGNLLQHSTGLRYAYDASGRMNAVYQAGGQRIVSFSYNNQGQRLLKTKFNPENSSLIGGTTYLYGASGELLGEAEYSSAGRHLVTRYWFWLESLPLAQLEINYESGAPSGFNIVFLHSDYMNTPRLASTHQGIVWSWSSDAYGASVPNEDVSGSGKLTHIPLRFPGQIYDEETRLAYNYHRDYDQNLGRYVQSDPTGLSGGLNTYNYGGGNPINNIDPDGLVCISSSGVVSCEVPGGPKIRFPAPNNWPEYIGATSSGYHFYNKAVSAEGAGRACLESFVRNNPTPGRPMPATVSGTLNDASPLWAKWMIASPVMSYEMSYNGSPVIVNVTLPGHPLFPGYVARTVDFESAGGMMNNFGEGLGWLQSSSNPLADFLINNIWYKLSADAVNSCSCGGR
ncbi:MULTISPECIES: RHS repeat-associated core domain-containing protein [unclassified Pseudomonas]|uniref:RHS repeat-associated core domain-containing protein n=1 Tax=unclassified Pseudomonas TaxID=196821 RepID=UPI00117A8C1E|nr:MULTISPECIES: RHS repeat-associated core domain-containing protein [unclassified Pseudomonas]